MATIDTKPEKDKNNLIFIQARPQDIESLSTIVPRSFFANEFMTKTFPDTPKMREWWAGVFKDYTGENGLYCPIAVDKSTGEVAGAMLLRRSRKEDPYGGMPAAYPATEDHHQEFWPMAIKGFAEDEEKYVGGRDRFLVEVIGVDGAWQGKGIGRKIINRCCEIADETGDPVWLETSMARKYWMRVGQGFVDCPDREEGTEEGGGALIRESPMRKKED